MKIIKLLLIPIFVIILVSCTCDSSKSTSSTKTKLSNERIKLVESASISARSYYIIEVDKHLYIFSSSGGGVHLESCPCKKSH